MLHASEIVILLVMAGVVAAAVFGIVALVRRARR